MDDYHLKTVLDPRIRIRGLPGLRVADASGMPAFYSDNIVAASIKICEKGADITTEDATR